MATLIHVLQGWPVRDSMFDPGRVNVFGPGAKQAKFELNCPHGPVDLVGYYGGVTPDELRSLEAELNSRLAEVC